MKADTFAKLLVLQTLVESEVGLLLEQRPVSLDLFREGLITRVSDLVDEVDSLDAVAAARTYDAIVDFLSQLPEDDDGIVETAIRFQRAMGRTVDRGMDQEERRLASTWAVVLNELLQELRDEYLHARFTGEEPRPRELARSLALLARAREAAERIAGEVGGAAGAELLSDVERVSFAIRHRRSPGPQVETLIAGAQRRAARHRPTPLSRIGSFVLGQVLSRDRRRRKGEPPGGVERRKRGTA